MALDPDNTNKGYLLGRLFATYEQAQTAALGSKVNATIKDKFYGAASAQPRKVFHMLESGSANHLSKIGKVSPGPKSQSGKADWCHHEPDGPVWRSVSGIAVCRRTGLVRPWLLSSAQRIFQENTPTRRHPQRVRGRRQHERASKPL